MAARYVTRDGDTVDYIVWRHYGPRSGRATELVLDANPGLADLAVLAGGMMITLPDLPMPASTPVIRIWG